jgi:LCP family protein required for cell wall assembly
VSDRFHNPEGPNPPNPNDPRRIFIPAPSGSPGGRTGAPPVRRPVAPDPVRDPRRVAGSPGGPGGPGPGRGGQGRGPGGPGRNGPGGRGPGDPYRSRGPGGAPVTAPKRPWFRRIRWRWIAIAMPVLLLLALLGGYMWANSVFNRIERVQTEGTLAGGGLGNGTNYLLVGSDSREPIEGDQSGFTDGDFPGGQRSDTMVVLHVGGDGTKILSIPRDLYVPIADTGDSSKINAAFNGGPPRLIRTISDNLDIPIHRYVEVDFVSFAGLVDGLGGITVDFPNPALDRNSGLFVPESGPVELDGDQALAYVRSRNYVEIINGEEQTDPTADLGRIQRQQAFLRAVFDKLGNTKNPITLARTLSNTTEGMRIDDEMGLFDAVRLAWTLRNGLDPEPLVLPTTQDRNESGAVLILDEGAAEPVLDQLR